MDKNYFSNKVYCEFVITSDIVEPEQLTRLLGISPHRSLCKGDTYESKYSGSLITHLHNLWAVTSKEIISKEQDIRPHILQIKSFLEKSIDELKKLKNNNNVELTLWLWFETEDAGIGIDLFEPEISFIHDITNRLHFSVITNIEN